MRRFWTADEEAVLARDYAARGAPAVAHDLGRTTLAVYQKVAALGLAHQPRTDTGPGFRAELRALHAEGLSDGQVAGKLGCERHTAARHRRALGLGSNRLHPAQRRRVAEATREQCRAAGVRSLAEVRAAAFRRYAAASGWPADLAPREVHILEALAARGPMTRPQIAEAIGLPWIGSRKSLASNTPGGSYLASLARRGLVARLGRLARGEGRGKSMDVYSLTLTAERGAPRA